jgi:hypothetical protein
MNLLDLVSSEQLEIPVITVALHKNFSIPNGLLRKNFMPLWFIVVMDSHFYFLINWVTRAKPPQLGFNEHE